MRKIYSSLSISKSIKNNSNSNQQKNNETVTYLQNRIVPNNLKKELQINTIVYRISKMLNEARISYEIQ